MRRAALALAMVGATPAHALWAKQGEAAGAALDGSVRSFGLISRDADLDTGASLHRLRLTLDGWVGQHLSWQVAGEGVVQVGQTVAPALAPATALRLIDLGGAHAGDDYALRPDLDRAYAGAKLGSVELRAGRQAIGHGSARALPSGDIFAPFPGFALDTEYKRGVDAGRVIVTLGPLSEVEALAVARQDDAARGLFLARARTQVWGVDVSGFAGSTYREATLALDLQGDLGGAGWYVDALDRPSLGFAGVRATAGASYRFDVDVTLTGEAHLDGGGATSRSGYAAAAERLGAAEGESFLRARGYGALLADYPLTPLLTVGLGWFQNLVDGSVLLSPALRWDVGQETVIDLGALWALGDEDAEFRDAVIVHGDLRVYF